MQDLTNSADSPTTDACPTWCTKVTCGSGRVHLSPDRSFRAAYDQVAFDLRLSSVTPDADGTGGEPTVVWLGQDRFLPHEALGLTVELIEADGLSVTHFGPLSVM
jgi:hypothetical protein